MACLASKMQRKPFLITGNANAKCTLFSFGSIKTCTALGGGVAIVRDPTVRARVRHVLEGHPMQLTREYAAKVAKAAAFTAVLRPSIFRRAVDAASYAGIDYGDVITRASRGFPEKTFFSAIRRRPCAALMAMMQKRFQSYDRASIKRRQLGASLQLDFGNADGVRIPDD